MIHMCDMTSSYVTCPTRVTFAGQPLEVEGSDGNLFAMEADKKTHVCDIRRATVGSGGL